MVTRRHLLPAIVGECPTSDPLDPCLSAGVPVAQPVDCHRDYQPEPIDTPLLIIARSPELAAAWTLKLDASREKDAQDSTPFGRGHRHLRNGHTWHLSTLAQTRDLVEP